MTKTQSFELLSRQAAAARMGYIASLDGWRALAVLGVMICHDLPFTLFGHSTAIYQGYGGYGVLMFFAISGFLITTRILEEERLCGVFQIRRFYIRRFFRIQPAAVSYLAVIGGLLAFHIFQDSWYSWIAALFLFVNYTYHEAPSTHTYTVGHFWSLAVEEHFYLLLSLLFLLVKRNRGVILALLYFASWLPLHISYAHLSIYRPDFSPRETQWNLQYLLLAALTAVALRKPAIIGLVRRFVRPWVMLLTTVISIPMHHVIWHAGLSGAVSFVAAYLSIFWIIATAFHPQSLTTRLLESKPLRFVGRISYSLYLWHVLFFFKISGMNVTNSLLLACSGRMAKYIAAFAAATLSYFFIEKPMIRIGHRLAPAASPGRPELADLPVETPLLPGISQTSAKGR